jgi:Protein of unknown function (DUF2946)
MDDLVKQAMTKWPDVPHCYGWLGLDARGNWCMRDDQAQAAGGFCSGCKGAKGSVLKHEKLVNFIERNYQCDDVGQWYFQNGPQRVFVELEVTAWVWRVGNDYAVTSHSGTPVQYQQGWMDEHGWLYLTTSGGFGLVHTQDVALAAQAIESGLWSVREVCRDVLASRFHYVQSPMKRHRQMNEDT